MQYRLGSNPMVNAPGIIAWAINGYHFEDDRQNLRNVITAGWNIPATVADRLLSGAIPYTIEKDVVVFTHEEK